MRLIFLSILFAVTLFAQQDSGEDTQSFNFFGFAKEKPADANKTTPVETHKVLYLNYEEVPKRIVAGEIFPVTIRTLSITNDYAQIDYNLSNKVDLRVLNELPYRIEDGKYFYDTFYFIASSNQSRLPDFKAHIEPNPEGKYETTTLKGKKLNVIALNPKKNFSNIIADDFSIIEYKTTSFDNEHNIIVFIAEAKRCDIAQLKFKNVFKQGVESTTESLDDSKVTYFVVVDKKLENFKFSYFNLVQNRFNNISIPIIVEEDKVATQTDIKPKDQSKQRIKLIVALCVAVVILILIVWSKKYLYSIILVFPVAYILFLSVPSKELCIKEGSNIYLLPVRNGTVFETTSQVIHLQQEGKARGFVKVKLSNNKIGWVKNENICKY